MVQTERSCRQQNKCLIKYGFFSLIGQKVLRENTDKHFPFFPFPFSKAFSVRGVNYLVKCYS